jgi:hypothetical protein
LFVFVAKTTCLFYPLLVPKKCFVKVPVLMHIS